ncbi:hypothetical protein L226DRAFT_183612 [Lentinus tigrinus ALCF2SS1-7]|uniref:uncharacterized protein n=1 Tax=Lentinus tigrinus ALCF2SS1-7 TaxID=1328758 RepID=UPI00116621E3|nr:hypothetical protein L226DRAFT_183612 [Lentinus tigrinus ALCF2SS1-7]
MTIGVRPANKRVRCINQKLEPCRACAAYSRSLLPLGRRRHGRTPRVSHWVAVAGSPAHVGQAQPRHRRRDRIVRQQWPMAPRTMGREPADRLRGPLSASAPCSDSDGLAQRRHAHPARVREKQAIRIRYIIRSSYSSADWVRKLLLHVWVDAGEQRDGDSKSTRLLTVTREKPGRGASQRHDNCVCV